LLHPKAIGRAIISDIDERSCGKKSNLIAKFIGSRLNRVYVILALGFGLFGWMVGFSALDSARQNALEATEQALVQAALPVPSLPFVDNPDPTQCGIPTRWGTTNNQAWLTGFYEGDLVQPIVYLYDSHLRRSVTASAPHGTEVEIVLVQENPTLDYYMVKIVGAPIEADEGWIPAPFLSFVAPAEAQ
jgi:hypothetical protein